MSEYIISKKALEDLRDIWIYTLDTWSEKQADNYYQKLIDAFEYIASKPSSVGRSYKEVRSDYRGFPCGKHIVFYRVLKNGKIKIVRILHERMDVQRHL